jgi:acyl-CoA synthetase (AMP-forming)/AMP-acid ligase II
VGDEGEELPERRVGEVQVAGPNVMRGYWNDPESTAEVRDGPWLRTGDLGYLADGELFLTGRAKDLIILQGRNYHAEDLERSAEKIDDVRGGAAVAFAVYDQEAARERVVLVCECRVANPEERDRLATRIRMRVQEDTTVPVDEVVLVDRDTVPKTSSGKRQRSRCRELYLEGRLRPAGTGKLGLARLALRSLAGHLKIWVRRIMPGGRSAG